MSIAINPYEIKADVPTYLTTTLYDLIAAFHSVVAPHEDALVVAIVACWLRAGRITLLGAGASRACGATRPWRCAGGASTRL